MIPAAQIERSRHLSRLSDYAQRLVERRLSALSTADGPVCIGDRCTVDRHGDGVLLSVDERKAWALIAGNVVSAPPSAVRPLARIEA